MNLDDPPRFLLPKTKIFLSVDLIGSTLDKQGETHLSKRKRSGLPDNLLGKSQYCLSNITTFYRLFEKTYFEKWHSSLKSEFYVKLCKGKSTLSDMADSEKAPQLFKIIGDELVFVVDVEELEEVLIHLSIWMDSVREFQNITRDREFSVKSTAWFAGFPLTNQEVVTLRNGLGETYEAAFDAVESGLVFSHYYCLALAYGDINVPGKVGSLSMMHTTRDYVGPSMDIGFRLSEFSDAYKLAISVDLAYVISSAGINSSFVNYRSEKFQIHYAGRKSIKGLTEGEGYPIFWLKLSDEPQSDENEYFRSDYRNGPIKMDYVRNFAQNYFDQVHEKDGPIIAPFFSKSRYDDLNQPEPGFYESLELINKCWKREVKSLESSGDLITSDGKGNVISEKESNNTINSLF